MYYNSKSLFSFMSMFGSQYIYYFWVISSFLYIFKTFKHFQDNPNITGSLLTFVFYSSLIILLLMSISSFMSIFSSQSKKKGKKLPLKQVIDVLKEMANYATCFINDSIEYLKNDIQNTNVLSIYILIGAILTVFVSYVVPRIMMYILLYDGKQLLNAPVYLNKSRYLISFDELNEEIINNNIFKYTSQTIYDKYNDFFSDKESYINLKDPALEYELNQRLDKIKGVLTQQFYKK